MPSTYTDHRQEARHSDDMQDIITAVPPWVLRWGITLFFGVIVMIAGLSAFIRYPDIVKASLKINSPNSSKPVVSKISGRLVKLLVTENKKVVSGQSLAYLESTADHEEVLLLLSKLEQLRQQTLQNQPLGTDLFNKTNNRQLGELQAAYQTFFETYLSYIASVSNGFLLKKQNYLQNDLVNLGKQQQQLNAEKEIQQRDFALAEQQLQMNKKLLDQKVETNAEYRQEESKYLAKKMPLVQMEASIITAADNYASKQKDILELVNQIREEKAKFLQSLNSLISAADDWKSKYILTASQTGMLTFAGSVQEHQQLSPGQEVFYINPGNDQFFGEMAISQNNMGKVREGQQVLVKLKGYPFEQYGMIRGHITSISDVPFQDSVFMSKVNFKFKNTSDLKKTIHLKQGMSADAEIITQDATILQRISWSLLKVGH
jgi:multidrug efflux pump subunit AcrA (membrane-fusion protein)